MLRHSLATQLVNGGVPIKQVSDVFGHASIDTTAIYTKVDLASLRQVPLAFALGAGGIDLESPFLSIPPLDFIAMRLLLI